MPAYFFIVQDVSAGCVGAVQTHPVWRSPMMSSRCPRPIGTRLSTALMPVCIGSFTEMRGIMPGAFTPTRARLACTGPWTTHACTHHSTDLSTWTTHTHAHITQQTYRRQLINRSSCGSTSHSTQNKSFRTHFPKPICWPGTVKTKRNTTKARIHQSKEMYYNTKKLTPGLVAFYNTRP